MAVVPPSPICFKAPLSAIPLPQSLLLSDPAKADFSQLSCVQWLPCQNKSVSVECSGDSK